MGLEFDPERLLVVFLFTKKGRDRRSVRKI